jgi:hypothetical protein
MRYLLGDLTPSEEESVEKAYVSESEAFHQLLAAEEDLIDAYVAGSLSDSDRRRFEERFLVSPERRERVAFARALASLESPAETAPRRARLPAWLPLAAALAAIIIGGAWLAGRTRALDGEARRAWAERDAAVHQGREAERRVAELDHRVAGLLDELAQSRAGGKAGAIAAFALTAGLERGSAAPILALTPATEWVRLSLRLEEDVHPTYAAAVETADGSGVARWGRLRSRAGAGGRAVEIMLPAGSLSDGTYLVTLTGASGRGELEGVGNYQLRVVKAR